MALLEQEFAAEMDAKYCLAVASGGYAMTTALRAIGVKPGDRVLTNAFTLAPVPGAIAAVGAVPVFVGVTEDLVIDLDDLAAKADQADVLLLSTCAAIFVIWIACWRFAVRPTSRSLKIAPIPWGRNGGADGRGGMALSGVIRPRLIST